MTELQLITYVLLTATSLHMALFDLRHHRIMDWHVLTVFLLGVVIQVVSPIRSPMMMIAGVATGYVGFECARILFRSWRGTEGLGFGDVKFLAAAGAWTGPAGLAYIILIASISGLGFAASRGTTMSLTSRIAFGPHLAIGLLCSVALQRYGLIPT